MIRTNLAMVAWFDKASVSHSVDSNLRWAVDPILLGEPIPAMNMFYVFMVPTPTLPQTCVISMNKLKGYLCLEI